MAEYVINTTATGCDGYCPASERVVRCRDCKFNARPNEGRHFGLCERHNDSIVTQDGFCSWGREA